MEYNILGKMIASTSTRDDEITIGFDDGVYVTIKAKAHASLDNGGRLRVEPFIHVSTDKVELKAEG